MPSNGEFINHQVNTANTSIPTGVSQNRPTKPVSCRWMWSRIFVRPFVVPTNTVVFIAVPHVWRRRNDNKYKHNSNTNASPLHTYTNAIGWKIMWRTQTQINWLWIVWVRVGVFVFGWLVGSHYGVRIFRCGCCCCCGTETTGNLFDAFHSKQFHNRILQSPFLLLTLQYRTTNKRTYVQF